jgi:hypothetical protein
MEIPTTAWLRTPHPPNSLLGGSKNQAPNVPLLRESPCGIGLGPLKTIAVQFRLTKDV